MERTVCADGIVRQGKGQGMSVFQDKGQRGVSVTCLHSGVVLPQQTAFYTNYLTPKQAKDCQERCDNGCGAAVA
jgi:hypothetical protein